MPNIGDRVRFLNDVGGGTITRIDGRMAYVEDNDGFETPCLLSELVVVMPAGHDAAEANGHSGKLYFDQKAFDKGRTSVQKEKPLPKEVAAPGPKAMERPKPKPEETPHGDRLNIALAFEPQDLKRLTESDFNTVLVNDSNYWLAFSIARRAGTERDWTPLFTSEVEPNMQIDLCVVSHKDLVGLERISFQCIAYKKDKPYERKNVVDITRRLDLTKFYKLHCFRPGLYFETPVLEIPLVKDDAVDAKVDSATLREILGATPIKSKERNREPKKPKDSPFKLLPLIEVDLHSGELLETTAGMDNSAILNYQLDTVRKTMAEHSRRKGQKIVFIHGKGEGVLRKAVRDLLSKEYPSSSQQDASFAEYGFGATLVTIH